MEKEFQTESFEASSKITIQLNSQQTVRFAASF